MNSGRENDGAGFCWQPHVAILERLPFEVEVVSFVRELLRPCGFWIGAGYCDETPPPLDADRRRNFDEVVLLFGDW